jgi:hypothetical protein
MRPLAQSRKLATLMMAAVIYAVSFPNRSFADDKSDNNPPAKAAGVMLDTPSPGLTERERMLLGRLEELEKRVAELESKGNPPASSKETPPSNAEPAPAVAPVPAASEATLNIIPREKSIAGVSAPAAVQDSLHGGKTPKSEPFAFADFTWLNGNSRTKESPLDSKYFTGEFRADSSYIYDFNHPKDDTLVGTSESGRTQEFQVQQLGIGGDFHVDHVRGRLMTQFGMFSTMTPRNDASTSRGQWNLSDAYRYLSEAYGGYHFDVMHGINVDAGIFMSYVGLFSYYNFDNWAYQPSYVSSNTPWFFNGVRVQIFPTEKLKIEPWFINGWQSYGRFNGRPGLGMQILWRPTGSISILTNNYGVGQDTLNTPGRTRMHSDSSIEFKYYDNPSRFLDKAAFSLTGDIGCESGGGVSCFGSRKGGPKQSFLGYMVYNRFWFDKDQYGLTLGGGKMNNPGRYLVLMPPINGATAASGTSYFTENPGDPFKAWDATATFDWMPKQFITFRWEFNHRAANVPYFSGPGGVTPDGGNTGAPGSVVPGFTPDLRKIENRLNLAILVKL